MIIEGVIVFGSLYGFINMELYFTAFQVWVTPSFGPNGLLKFQINLLEHSCWAKYQAN